MNLRKKFPSSLGRDFAGPSWRLVLAMGSTVFALNLSIPEKAEAIPTIIALEARVMLVKDTDNLLLNQINVGDTVKGQYVFDSETPDTDFVHSSGVSPSVGRYWHYSSPYGLSLEAGGFSFQSDPDDTEFLIEICDDHTLVEPDIARDNYLLGSYRNLPLYPGVSVDHITWQLDNDSGSAVDSDALPPGAPILVDWPDTFAHLTVEGSADDGDGCSGYSIRAQVMAVEVIPEPCTLALLFLGVFALRRRV